MRDGCEAEECRLARVERRLKREGADAELPMPSSGPPTNHHHVLSPLRVMAASGAKPSAPRVNARETAPCPKCTHVRGAAGGRHAQNES